MIIERYKRYAQRNPMLLPVLKLSFNSLPFSPLATVVLMVCMLCPQWEPLQWAWSLGRNRQWRRYRDAHQRGRWVKIQVHGCGMKCIRLGCLIHTNNIHTHARVKYCTVPSMWCGCTYVFPSVCGVVRVKPRFLHVSAANPVFQLLNAVTLKCQGTGLS